MNDRSKANPPRAPQPAPADARPHAPWPVWRVVVAYAILASLAAAGIWYIDLKAHEVVLSFRP
jgi:hypothetical protein